MLMKEINNAVKASMVKDTDDIFRFDVVISVSLLTQQKMQLVSNASDMELKEFAKNNLKLFPGFQDYRRVPRSKIIEKMISYITPNLDSIDNQARIANDCNFEILQSFEIPTDNIGALKYTRFTYEDDQINYELLVELQPKITPVDVTKFNVTQYKVDITNEDIEKSLESWALSNTKPAETTPRMINNGDTVLVDLSLQVNGQSDDRKNLMIKVGSGMFALIEPYLVGKMPGDVIEERPKLKRGMIADPKLDGKQMIIKVKIHQVFDSVNHKVDAEMAQAMGYANLDEARNGLRQSLKDEVDQLNTLLARVQIEDQIVQSTDVNLPENFLENQAKEIAKALYNIPWNPNPDELRKYMNIDVETFHNRFKNLAKRRILAMATLDSIRNEKNIVLSQEEEAKIIGDYLKKFPFSAEESAEAFKMLDAQKHLFSSLCVAGLELKVIKAVIGICNINTKDLTLDELRQRAARIVPSSLVGENFDEEIEKIVEDPAPLNISVDESLSAKDSTAELDVTVAKRNTANNKNTDATKKPKVEKKLSTEESKSIQENASAPDVKVAKHKTTNDNATESTKKPRADKNNKSDSKNE